MVTTMKEVNGARMVIARTPNGNVFGAAVWEASPGTFHAVMRQSKSGKLVSQFHYEGSRLDYASAWAASHINKASEQVAP